MPERSPWDLNNGKLTFAVILAVFIILFIIVIPYLGDRHGQRCDFHSIEDTAVQLLETYNGTMDSGRFIRVMEIRTGIEHAPAGSCISKTIVESNKIIYYDVGDGFFGDQKIELIKNE